jgi:putative ABC transport system permease protein
MIGGNSSTLSADNLAKIKDVDNVKGEVTILTDSLSTEGSVQPMMGASDSPKTSLKSPVALKKSTNSNGMTTYSGGGLMVAGGLPENFSPPLNMAGSSDPTNENTVAGGSSLNVTSGKAIDGTKDSNEVMLSEAMAEKNSLKVGDTFTAYDTTLTVKGLFKASTESGNNTIIVSLPTQQRLSDRSGQVSTAVVTVDSLDNLKSATDAIKAKLGDSADVTSAVDQADTALKPLASVMKVALFSLIGSVVAGGVVILMIMIMIVRERRREIGILKAIGASNTRIVLQFMSEALTLTLIGAVIGLIIGVVGGHPVTASLVDSSVSGSVSSAGGLPPRPLAVNVGDLKDIQAQVGFSVILAGLGGALVIAIFGSACAGWLIAKVRPSEVMRQE